MKALARVMGCLLLLLSLSSCGTDVEEGNTSHNEEESTMSTTTQTTKGTAVAQSPVSVPTDGQTEQSLVYKSVNGKDIYLEFLPPTATVYAKAPVYYILSGGGWASCSRENMIAFSGYSVRKLREKGFAVVSADYRLVGDGAVMEDMVSDVMDAARYLKKYANILQIDADKIVTSGHSAGGQLALMLAYAPHDFTEESVLTDFDFTVIGTVPLSAPTVMYPDEEDAYLCSFTTDHLFACKWADSEEGRRGICLSDLIKLRTAFIHG